MLSSLDFVSLPTAFLLLLAVTVLSALFLLCPKVPLQFVRIHVGIIIVTTDSRPVSPYF